MEEISKSSVIIHPDLEFTFGSFTGVNTIACIPASEEISLLPVMASLCACKCIESFGVVIVFNSSETASEEAIRINRDAYKEIQQELENGKVLFPVHIALYTALPAKKAGVGLARKLAMDKAATLMDHNAVNKVLLCLDADCTVADNWINACQDYFETHKSVLAASVYFEHPIPSSGILEEAIVKYELHLRYLKQSLQWCGYPWYFHTVGSSMAVRVDSYLKNGGMNTRQAGEDFYFLHKLMPLGFGEILNTTVFPQARYSNRVPFGTGKSMLEHEANPFLSTYSFNSFVILKRFFNQMQNTHPTGFVNWIDYCEPHLRDFLIQEDFEKARQEAVKNTSSPEMASKRLWTWFSGFRIIKCLHYLREFAFPDQDVSTEVTKMLNDETILNEKELLMELRKRDRLGTL
jgi:hypothetical protein